MVPTKLRFSVVTALIVALVAVPALAAAEDQYLQPFSGNVSESPWWVAIDDPILTDLIERGLQKNEDVAVARSRLNQAQAVAWQTLSPVLPQIGVEISGRDAAIEGLGERTIQQLEMAGEDVPDSYQSGSAMLVGQLQLDLFGKRILNHIGTRKDAQSTMYDNETLATTVAISIAQSYYDILAGRERVKAVQEQIKANEELLQLVTLRYERGDATGLEVLQQRQQLASTATRLPAAEAALEAAELQLAVLLGREPQNKIDLPTKPLPEMSGDIPTGRPSDLAANRPEMKAAAMSFDAESYRKYSAIMSFFPTLQAYGQIGEQATWIVDKEQQSVWEVGLTLSIPIFQGGSNIAGYRQAKAAQTAARRELRKQTLESNRKVESAVVSEKLAARQLDAYSTQFEAASSALKQSKQRYVLGVADFQTVLTAINTKQLAELNMIEARVARIVARISLLDAIGGSWTEEFLQKAGGAQ